MLDKPSEEIKQKLNIVDIVGEYVQLKKAGQNHRACCPFHNEKTPSFMVSEEKQIFKCFGCSEGGDVFSFIMKIEGIEFIDALKLLAGKAGVELKQQDPREQSKRNRILEVLDLTAKFFNKALFESKEGKVARDYLAKRKMEEVTQDEFMIGYSPDSWDILTQFLKKKRYNDEEIVESGLVVRKDSGLGYYDRFRGRLMFPIWDVHGSVVGFGGRVLEGGCHPNGWSADRLKKQAKYLNSPQGLVYDKSRMLYGINKAKQEIRKNDLAIVVEGYMDVIASHETGIKNVVSASGTALTSEQIDLLKRYTNNLLLSFDMDAAGDMATKRGIEIAQQKGMNLKILQLPKGKDPDECIREDAAIWKEAINSAKSIMDYYFENILKGLDLSKVEDKKKAAAGLLTQIKNIPDRIEQSHYLQKLAGLLNVDEQILQESMNKPVNENKYNKNLKEVKNMATNKESEEDILARRLLSMILGKIRLFEFVEPILEPEYLPENIIPLYSELISEYNNLGNELDIVKFTVKLYKSNQEIAFMAKEFLLYFEKEFNEEDLSDFEEFKREALLLSERLKRKFLARKIDIIEKEMKEAESVGDNDKIAKLTSDFSKISSSFK
jgi:DNA primase